MPPKGQQKINEKVKQKIIEDKTFGLKNKNKSKVVQQYVQQVQKTVDARTAAIKRVEGPSKKELKEEKEKFQAELLSVIRPVQQAKVPAGADAKSVVCEYFKQGLCAKGAKCKFSHDLTQERKGAKIDLYTDQREAKEEDKGMEGWDQQTLEDAVAKQMNRCQTDIICKYFLEAVESRKYGWFWNCPNGNDKCIYRHALPPGYVLRSDKKKLEEQEAMEEVILEEEVEEQRKKVVGATPVTLENFLEWRRRKAEKVAAENAEQAKKAIEAGKHKKPTQMSGRALFEFNPDLFVDDDEGVEAYERNEDADEDVVEISASGTSISYSRKTGKEDGGEGDEGEDGGGGDGEEDGAAGAAAAGGGSMQIQASLFLEGDVPDDLPDDDE